MNVLIRTISALAVMTAVGVIQLALVCPAQAQGQPQNAGTINYEYSDRIDQSKNVAPLGDSLFGDATNNENGATSFSVTDVKAATNVRLPVQLGRTLTVPGSSSSYTVKVDPLPDIFGRGWSADIPYIENDALAQGWTASQGVNGSWGRCSSGNFSVSAANVSQIVVWAHNFFFGNDINIPGYGKERLLALRSDGLRPTDGATYVGTTRSNWKISCLPTIKNGTGEGFVVTLPDGAKYYFDWLASADTGYLSTQRGILSLRQFRLYATKAVDRFGGTVEYTFDVANPHRIKQIKSSDGAIISVAYNPNNGKVASASLGTRTWQYAYGGDSSAWDHITTATLPDGSKWSYSLPPKGVDGRVGLQACEFTVGTRSSSVAPGPSEAQTYQIVHPSGAIGNFSFRAIMFGYNRTPGLCQPGDYIPKAYIGNALYAKSISGPGVATKTWSVAYYPSWSYASECVGCPTTARTVVTETGRTITHVFGNDYSTNAGQLLSTTTSGGGVSSVETFQYLTSAAGQQFPDSVGTDNYQITSNPLMLKNRPQKSKTITQDGRAFTSTVEAYDQFVRPTQVKRTSAPAP